MTDPHPILLLRRTGGSVCARAWMSLLLLSCLANAIPRGAAAQENEISEYELKAAILYKLTNFVEWPDAAYPGPSAPTVLCILGRDPFGPALTSGTPKGGARGRPIVVRRIQQAKDSPDCHILYISSSERKTVGQIFSGLKGTSVLTVGEMTQFAANGGMIQFSLEDQQVRFDINLDAALRGQLKVSSKLLALARIVREPGSGVDAKKAASALPSLALPGN